MIADSCFDARIARAPPNHPVAVLLRHAVRPPGEAPGGAKQRTVSVVCNARSRDVCVQIGFEFGHARCFVFLAPFFVQTYLSAPPLAEVISDIHLQDRADAGEGVNHHGDQRTVAQARERACVDGGEQGRAPPRG